MYKHLCKCNLVSARQYYLYDNVYSWYLDCHMRLEWLVLAFSRSKGPKPYTCHLHAASSLIDAYLPHKTIYNLSLWLYIHFNETVFVNCCEVMDPEVTRRILSQLHNRKDVWWRWRRSIKVICHSVDDNSTEFKH